MALYILKRLLMSVLIAVLLVVALAAVIDVIPGKPAETILGQNATPALIAQLNKEMGLNRPIWDQVWVFLSGVIRGNLGQDVVTNEPVASLVIGVLPYTVALAVTGLGIAIVVGIPMGVYAAAHPRTVIDRLTRVVSISMITMPAYVAGLLLLLLFSVKFPILPSIGGGSAAQPIDYIRHLILPGVALGITWIGYLARLVRTSMLEIVESESIQASIGYGLSRRKVYYKYALKNALIPTVAVLGVGLGHLLAGAVFVEVIFARPGLGSLMVQSINGRDYPVVRGCVLVIALLFVFANLAADLTYRLLDPRMRLGKG